MAKKVEAKSRWVRRSAEQGLALVAQYRASGESAAGFCRRAGVGLHVLRYWLNKRVEPNEHPSEFFVVSPPARESQVGEMEAAAAEGDGGGRSAFIVIVPDASPLVLARTVRELLAGVRS